MATTKNSIPNTDEATQAFDEIMAEIEPDLCTYNLDALAEKYKDETEPAKQKRILHYEESLARCFAALEEAVNTWSNGMIDKKQQLQELAEKKSLTRDEQVISNLEEQF